MASTAANFFTSTVEPTVAEFEKAPDSLRLGRLAAIVLYQMADHFALEGYAGNERGKMDELVEKVRLDMCLLCPDFLLVRDIADATKHAKLSVSKKLPRQLSSSEQVTTTPGLFNAPFGYGVFREAARVFVTLDDGTVKQLLPAVRSVLAAWKAKL